MYERILIIVLVTVALLIVSIAGIFIIILVRNKKYKKFVLENSQAIKELENVNSRYDFEVYESEITYKHKFDNKRNWYRTSPVSYLSMHIRDNLEYWLEIMSKIEYNLSLLPEYKKEVSDVYLPISEELCSNAKFRHKKALNIEKRCFDRKTLHPNTTLTIKIYLRYVSPKGKVDETKSERFNYTQVKRILDSVSTKWVDRETYLRIAAARRGMLSDSIRYEVLKRDGFRCVLCGMSSKDGAILHVDHIIPVSKGGKNEMSNLRTLCEKCNIGKSNKIE